MAIRSMSMGSLLQGVSQQPDRIRLEGQVSEQVNMISDVDLGLSSRPGTNWIGYLPNAGDIVNYRNIKFNGVSYIMGWKAGTLRMWNEDTGQPVTVNQNGFGPYIGDDMRFHVVNMPDEKKHIVALNRDMYVKKQTVAPRTSGYYGVFHLLGGQFSHNYNIRVSFLNGGPTISFTYEAPDGDNSGDSGMTTSGYIATMLYDGLRNHAQWPANAQITRAGDVVAIWHPTQPVRLVGNDGTGGEVLRTVTDTIKDTSDLPKTAPNGMVVKVSENGDAAGSYYLKFKAKNTNVENGLTGFGEEGTWLETYALDEDRAWDLSTMPHILTQQSNGTFLLERGPWIARPVGDSINSKFSSILGKRIRDIGGFESRVVLLSTSTVVMTRTNEPFDLWRNSATVLAATDPIDITSTKKDDLVLDWIVPFDRDLFIMADPGDSQFVIRGGGIEPQNAGMVLTTEFEISSGGTAPVSTGRTILFPYLVGDYSGIKEFYTAANSSAQAANSLTEGVSRYIKGAVRHMAVSQNFNFALFQAEPEDTLWIYKFLWNGSELVQSAWATWKFNYQILHFHFDNSRVTFIQRHTDGQVFTSYLDLNRPEGPYGYHESLDTKLTRVVSPELTVEVPFPNARFIQSTGTEYPGMEILATSVQVIDPSTWRYTFNPIFVQAGQSLLCGQTMEWRLSPSEPMAKDHRDRVDTSRQITVQEYWINISNSGEFVSKMDSLYSPSYEHDFPRFYFDNEPDFPNQNALFNGEISIPWGERADWSKLTLIGRDVKPVTILELGWSGQILNTKGRTI